MRNVHQKKTMKNIAENLMMDITKLKPDMMSLS